MVTLLCQIVQVVLLLGCQLLRSHLRQVFYFIVLDLDIHAATFIERPYFIQWKKVPLLYGLLSRETVYLLQRLLFLLAIGIVIVLWILTVHPAEVAAFLL